MKKDEFLSIKTWEEYDKRREEFRGIEWDREVIAHWEKLADTVNGDFLTDSNIDKGLIVDVYKSPDGHM